MIFVTSWDDGPVADMRIAELLDRHGLAGTFYVPIDNGKYAPRLSNSNLRELDNRFEIASHTLNHTRLHNLANKRVEEEVKGGKIGLEDILGHSVDGFCYPGGHITPYVINCLRKNGIRYARTIENLCLDVGNDPFRVPTTIQLYPNRKKQIYFRNYIRRGNFMNRWGCFMRAMTTNGSLWDLLDRFAEDCYKKDGVLHIWGHGWEVENFDLWEELDAFFSRIKQFAPTPMTVAQSVEHISKADNADEGF